jgi:hypothetical protein
MVNLGGGILKTSPNVLRFEVGIIRKYLCLIRSAGQHVQNILDANAHTANAGASPTLSWVGGYAVYQLGAHVSIFDANPISNSVCEDAVSGARINVSFDGMPALCGVNTDVFTHSALTIPQSKLCCPVGILKVFHAEAAREPAFSSSPSPP